MLNYVPIVNGYILKIYGYKCLVWYARRAQITYDEEKSSYQKKANHEALKDSC